MLRMIRVLWLLIMLIPSGAYAKDKVIIAVGEYPPLVSEHLKHYGVTARIVVEAFALEGVDVEYKFTNWARAFHLVNEGAADAIGPILKNKERQTVYDFSDSMLYETQVFFHIKSTDFTWHRIEDLKRFEIGATIAYSYGRAFDIAATTGEISVQRVPSDLQNFKKLFNDRIDIFPQSIDVGYYMLQTEFPSKTTLVTHHPHFVNQSDNYLAFSKKNPRSQHYLTLFNRGLATLKATGKYEQYFQESRNGDYIIK
ncbi:amino acid ABC transporter substrate-binding protein [Psychromonas sp. psych-6C06]|uniref:substrate-binding periplasmic protein n=1 Tax=Psychromonas sp. psych-6C06 TaxID=2058089 RepID=UPI000C32BF75|nr:transporter substrate-binding domain-containing protein [Psychromonas sp. psych-6C06]PKF63531.1 amino acid ABC transporter substrate-binding protein [Psychromonas sp. psych-6C06]